MVMDLLEDDAKAESYLDLLIEKLSVPPRANSDSDPLEPCDWIAGKSTYEHLGTNVSRNKS